MIGYKKFMAWLRMRWTMRRVFRQHDTLMRRLAETEYCERLARITWSNGAEYSGPLR